MKNEFQIRAIVDQLNVQHGQGRDILVDGKPAMRIAAVGKYFFICSAEEMNRESFMGYVKRIAGGRYAPNEIIGILGTLSFEEYKARAIEIAQA
jgi:hypothetical protein